MGPGRCAGSRLSSSWPPELGPELALARGRWVKLICGASNQDLEAIEDLCGLYALAGVHCIDGAADQAVVAAIRRGVAWAQERGAARPWLMLSLSDGDDPHFRKAWFDPSRCPSSCLRPCERVCPAAAIGERDTGAPGVMEARCYGCGRCLPACPLGLIEGRSQVLAAEAVAPLLVQVRPDALELHTQPGRLQAFGERLDQLVASGISVKRLAVSAGAEVGARELWQRFSLLRARGLRPLWQLDGRPMSGDVGEGTAHAAVRLLAQRAHEAPPGPLQLAGGTNGATLRQLEAQPSLAPLAAGVAFGGVARRQLQPWLLAAQQRGNRLLADGELWPQALEVVQRLVRPWLERA